ncbi:hypothetical protein [Mesorhizobium erdmanii]|nr:hypothetical protein [Mesorhizobium erdmanii]
MIADSSGEVHAAPESLAEGIYLLPRRVPSGILDPDMFSKPQE